MKKTVLPLLFSFLYVFTACEGPVGPEGIPGPQGPPGEDGLYTVGSVIEIEGDFNPNNEYAFGFTFPPEDVEVFESDAVLVYILWEVGEDTNGDPLPIWRLLPQSIFLEEGVLQYNYDHTYLDVNIFLDGAIDFSTLDNQWTQDQVFRIVIAPADFIDPNARVDIDYSNYEEVIHTFGLDDSNVKRY